MHLDDQKSHESRRQLSPERPVCLMAEAENTEFDLDNTAGPSKKEAPRNIDVAVDSTIHSAQGRLTSFLQHSNSVLNCMMWNEAN